MALRVTPNGSTPKQYESEPATGTGVHGLVNSEPCESETKPRSHVDTDRGTAVRAGDTNAQPHIMHARTADVTIAKPDC